MIKVQKFTDTEQSKLLVSGCLHLNHNPKWENPIWHLRGFESSEQMTETILKSINDTCRPQDTLLVLGDFCLNTTEQQFYQLIEKINCNLLFLRGNHNNPWEKLYLSHCIQKFGYEVLGYKFLDKIIYLGDYIDLHWNKQLFVCNHYPFYIWDKIGHGAISLVSHSHGSCQLTLPTDTTMKQIDCGWDVWRKPIGFKEIMDCANKKSVAKNDKH